ncbi:hypothetical protein N7474_004850 [Penicillium riverlandense]|uniref:uncharacterized protein n=1 Tax=Penicillium riverlandense TaxID=1903569 RepID=UPI002549817B|nr:uncharacterized protein N7474_004850 [Penicillium riverlandense]KAJ5819259.1 hypothetical protein N7474_004850 [Penicillium riverlandense]
MSSTAASEDVNDFLLRIRELGERRDKEDEERTKRLEEEILQGRAERQARRAERARSISPQKDSPTLNAFRMSASIEPPEHLEPTPHSLDLDRPSSSQGTESLNADQKRPGSSPKDAEMDSLSRTLPPLSRSRAGTLSWQQRPSSRDSGNKSPSSPSPSRSSHLRNASTASREDQPLSRAQIAQSLGSKDPSWFRQTPDRGTGSPAYRKTTEEVSGTSPGWGASRRLPGMSRESTAEPEKAETADEAPPSSPRTASTLATGLGSPVSLSSAPKLKPRVPESEEDLAPPSPTQRRMSPERTRSTSPTKGLGGFVQSAMLKRSDSVSKRWSAQVPQRLSRSNSVVSNFSSAAPPTLNASVSDLTASTGSRFGRDTQVQRPSSSHSEATTVQPTESNARPVTAGAPVDNTSATGSPTRRPPSSHSRSTSSMTMERQDSQSSPFVSRTMDPKRWSPTKASWLESALNRPDSPRHNRQPSEQPSWMKDRQARGSVDMGSVKNFKEVNPVGLMRTPPPGTHFKKPSVSGVPSLHASPDLAKSKESVPESPSPAAGKNSEPMKPVEEEGKPTSPARTAQSPEHKTEAERTPEPERTRKAPPPALSPKPNFTSSPGPSREPVSPQPKSQSPALDFRASLRKREVPQGTGPKDEPEFKNVFGKLKKTETKNYVAPDELKNNILRGKAALNLTGGPKKTQRVDEFKESILKQKEAMKAGGGTVRRNTAGEDDRPLSPATAVPEAIAKRQNMAKTHSIRGKPSDEQPSRSSRDLATPRTVLNPTPAPTAEEESPKPPPEVADPVQEPAPTDPETRGAVIEASVEAKQKPADEAPKPVRGLPSAAVAGATAPATTVPPSLAAKGKLAGRINPALAGLLSRGPTAAAEVPKKEPVMSSASTETSPASSSTPLTHMTKSRAKGPKRRAPKASAPPASQDSKEVAVTSPPEVKKFQPNLMPIDPGNSSQNLSRPASAKPGQALSKPVPGKKRNSFQDLLNNGIEQSRAFEASAPPAPRGSEEVGVVSSAEVKKSHPGPVPIDSDKSAESLSRPCSTQPAKTSSKPGPETKRNSFQDLLNNGLEQRLQTPPPKPRVLSNEAALRSLEGAPREPESSAEEVSPSSKPPVPPKPSPSPSPSPPVSAKPRWSQQSRYTSSPSPLRTSYRENRMDAPTTPQPKSVPGVAVAEAHDPSPRTSHASPPIPPKRFDISLDKPVDPRNRLSRKMSAPSLVAKAAEAQEVIAGFFKTFPNQRDRVDIDPQLMLTSKPAEPKIRTTKKHIWEMTGDGKRQELPVNQEYILYEGSMYLCVHVFDTQGIPTTEVYLWCGDDVGEAAFEDTQLFARKISRENGCKLELIRQGKEPARFIQALGGIIITRRGPSSRSSSSALYMLCGRKYLGQMAFDEVDYSLRHLCSGYPFVISAPFGKLYLWKGKGSGPEETGAARLISMDLGLTGEFEEVTEDEEPESFFEVFAGSRASAPSTMASDYWQLKPKFDHFSTRLLRVDHELGQAPRFWMRRPGSGSPVTRPNDTVQEIEPFCYKDLAGKDIYVLDTFFELYVIVGEQATQKSADFSSAVIFAHEYGILATSLQDRPFIPKSFVSLGGIPDRCQAAFRKWDPHSLRAPCVFSLDVAIEALRTPPGSS